MVITTMAGLPQHTTAVVIMIVVATSNVATLMDKDNVHILIMKEVSALQIVALELVFNHKESQNISLV